MALRTLALLPLLSSLACGDPPAVAPSTSPSERGALITCKGHAAVGNLASPFELASINAGLAVVKPGRVVVVDFWATWCEPCEKAFPRFQEIYERHKDRGLELVAVSVDDHNDNIGAFARRYAVTFPVVWDAGKKVSTCYTPPNVPATYVIDRDGVIRFMQDRYNDGDETELERQIQKLL